MQFVCENSMCGIELMGKMIVIHKWEKLADLFVNLSIKCIKDREIDGELLK